MGEGSEKERPAWGTPEGQRIVDLLWAPRTPPARGPRPKTSVDAIVAAAIELADAQGFDALSMRALARQLGVGAMTLYSYVPGKAELFELMIDAAYGERILPEVTLDWRARYRHHAVEAREMYRHHPWLLESNLWRLPLGPHVLDLNEDLLAIGQAAGLDYERGVRVASLLEAYCFGIARGEIADRDEARRTGQSADDFWEARAGFWETYFSPERYPTMLATWGSGAYDSPLETDSDLGFAVDLILDSVARLVGRQQSAQ